MVFDERSQIAYLIKNKVHVFGRASVTIVIRSTVSVGRNWVRCRNDLNVKTARAGLKIRGNHFLIAWWACTNLMLDAGWDFDGHGTYRWWVRIVQIA